MPHPQNTQSVEDLVQELRTLHCFRCIDSNCDGRGNIPHQVGENEWEAQQCQYCAEIRLPTIEFFHKALTTAIESERARIQEAMKQASGGGNWRRILLQALNPKE